jgi:hypothetical protein
VDALDKRIHVLIMGAMSNAINTVPAYILESAANGYPFECGCGEMYKSDVAAISCRKCRTYLMDEDFATRCVTFWTESGESRVIWGTDRAAERAAAALEAELLAAASRPAEPLTYNPFRSL